jgi:hypothetical protein
MQTSFDWDSNKNEENHKKHHVNFETAQYAFFDPNRLVVHDEKHSGEEERYFCIGKVGEQVLTVRFTYRGETIRIFGAAQWRKQKQLYEETLNEKDNS